MALRTTAFLISEAAEFVKGDVLDAGSGDAPFKRLFDHSVKSWTTLDARPVADTQQDFDHPFEGSYDTVVCTDALQFSREPKQALFNLAYVLNKGGHLVITAPNCWHEDQISRWRFPIGGLGELVESAGLDIVYLDGLGGLMTMEAEAVNMIGEYASNIPASFRGFIGRFDHLYPMMSACIARK
jgi:SAM-dependent methyltransferase